MIRSKKDLVDFIEYEAHLYGEEKSSLKRILFPSYHPYSTTFRYLKELRTTEYYSNRKGLYNKLLFKYHLHCVQRLGQLYNLDIGINVADKGLMIYHNAGGIVINCNAKIGVNCHLHGNNCIGNDGIHVKEAPRIGNNVHIGFGAVVIGDVTIADNIWIAAGAVVVSSFTEPGIIIGGIPARKIKEK